MPELLFSIVIPTFNRRHLVQDALDSALAQDYAGECEVLVGDDGSTDGTPEFIEQHYGSRVQVFRQANAGPGPARNLACQHARGAYLAFLDSDDMLTPWALSTYARIIAECDHPSVLVGVPQPVQTAAELSDIPTGEARWQRYNSLFESRMAVPLLATDRLTVRRDVFEATGGFTGEIRNGEDVDFFVRCGLSPGYVVIESPITFARRYHPGQITLGTDSAYQGRMWLLDQELAGRYPGGDEYLPHRRQILSFWARVASNQMTRAGRFDRGWEFYKRVFWWHVRQRRWKYLLGYPVVSSCRKIQQLSKPKPKGALNPDA
ncbi:glycosyltransferase family 2 protein [Aeoliella sp. ICT_H6.2]|uniref:Glycosyltransferase family 2 protein n=1 Tax=Aeoliella straminimaris TaxID=2954799 RepID=A0A9X2FBW0_9BACT|nr:glycosyltransferase family A protein [Aeoliella straminimaris]MCO6045247.1 glycosyltransferase family 2 protein [Aeoliella straminimaris]